MRGTPQKALHPLERVKQLMGANGTLHEAAKQVNKVLGALHGDALPLALA